MFNNIAPAEWEHIAYFFAGVIVSGIFSGLAFILNQRMMLKDIYNSNRQIKL